MTTDRHTATILRDGAVMAEIAAREPDVRIEQYPEWTMLDLLAHTGMVHRWVTELVTTAATEHIDSQPNSERDPQVLGAWFEEGLQALVDALGAVDRAMPMWTITDEGTADFWIHRMTNETALHRWDAERANGSTRPVDTWVALEGIVESLQMHVVQALEGFGLRVGPDRLDLHATDGSGTWHLRLGPDGATLVDPDGPADATVSGTPSDLWLYLVSRPNACVISGDRAVARSLETALEGVDVPTE